MEYSGPERRVHKVFVTRNTEYHLRKTLCVAVRNRNTGSWYGEHEALGESVAASISYSDNGGIDAIVRDLPGVGQSLYFTRDERDPLISSPVTDVQRPPKTIVQSYLL